MEKRKDITAKILLPTLEHGPDKSTCPSEVDRLLFLDNWRIRMGDVMDSAIGLQKQGKIVITQKGIPVDVADSKGPIRLKIV